MTATTYNAANRMTKFGAETLTYDLNGNLTSDGTDTFLWNARNQLASMSGPGLTASFVYDPFGRRTKKTINGVLTEYLHDGANPIQELSGATVKASLLTGLGMDEYFSRTEGAVTRSLLPDGLGSTVALTDSAGTVQTHYTYEPFGDTTVTGAASTNPFQYTGRENDGTTGVYYYRARYYHPTLQRFISEDPIGFAGGDVNLYGYVGNSPINFTDPTGQGPTTALVIADFCLGMELGQTISDLTGPVDLQESLSTLEDLIEKIDRRLESCSSIEQEIALRQAKEQLIAAIAQVIQQQLKGMGGIASDATREALCIIATGIGSLPVFP